MSEQNSVIEMQKTFEEMAGFRANAEITEDGALESADKIVDLQGKLILKTTSPIDLFSATIATSQLIQWYDQRQRKASKTGSTVEYVEILAGVKEKFSRGNMDEKAIKRLTARQYVADPKLGATKAMDTLQQLRSLYPDASLRE
ncbi:MAG TPA: hypothetical protein ACFYEK_16700 [Candidatus Wunengus sp. YC60]|uniref:hypothetical protein n=1 Tax=Candidatus Wunengus sp. YC60 TaxID=3367697 RepID=UPI0040293DED